MLLRRYWLIYKPKRLLFDGRFADQPLNTKSAQCVFSQAKAKTGITKEGGIHSLRHAYATHQLEQGTPIHQLSKFMGHSSLSTTSRYLHWVHGNTTVCMDLLQGMTSKLPIFKGE